MNNLVNVNFGIGEDGLTDKERAQAEKSMAGFVLRPPEVIIGEWYNDHLPFRSDQPLELNVRMAHEFGIKEAVIIQKICELEFTCGYRRPEFDDKEWVKLTVEDLVNEIGNLWSRTSVNGALRKLREKKILLVHRFNTDKWDRTNWYRIDYKRLERICSK